MISIKLLKPQETTLQPYLISNFLNNRPIMLYKHMFGLSENRSNRNTAFRYVDGQIIMPYHFPHPEHEIAHFVEINRSRLHQNDFGIKSFIPPNKASAVFSAVARETRVRAIEQRLLDKYSDRKIVKIFDSKSWRKMIMQHLPFGIFDTIGRVEEWVNSIHSKTYNSWSLDRIKYEWNDRMNIIQNYLEVMGK